MVSNNNTDDSQSQFQMGAQSILSSPFGQVAQNMMTQAVTGATNDSTNADNNNNNFLGSQANQMAVNLAGQVFKGKVDEVMEQNKGYLAWCNLDMFKDYFDVTNQYVLKKTLVILFPFTVKGEDGWNRQSSFSYEFNGAEDSDSSNTPRNDLQAPDLYIPLMSFVTFLILGGCVQGFNKGSFDMKELFMLQSFVFFFWLFETLILKGCFYFMNIANLPFIELLCYTGYKFLALCLIVAADGLTGKMGSYAALAICGGLFCWFFYKTLRRSVTSTKLADHIKQVSMNKQTFLMVACACQILILWLLSCQY